MHEQRHAGILALINLIQVKLKHVRNWSIKVREHRCREMTREWRNVFFEISEEEEERRGRKRKKKKKKRRRRKEFEKKERKEV